MAVIDATTEYGILVLNLNQLRFLRDQHPMGSEIRQAYNSACDRLDVLCSKVSEAHRLSLETKLRY